MDKQKAILENLKQYHTGRERAVHSKDLERLFLIDRRGLQRKISNLRKAGYPICSGGSGYYYAQDQYEINTMVCKLTGCVTALSNARNGMLLATKPSADNVAIDLHIHLN